MQEDHKEALPASASPRRVRAILYGALVLFLAIVWTIAGGHHASPTTSTPMPATSSPTATATPSDASPSVEAAATAAPAGSDGEIAPNTILVTRVVDGDTIELETGQRVRYIGVNTPETVDPRRPVQCFGHEASAKNTELVLGKRVRLEKDISETDKYGRLLRYVYLGDAMVNDTLVREGYAYADPFPPDVQYRDQFASAQADARLHERGLWSACPQKTSRTGAAVTVPADTTNTAASPPGQCVIKGNIGSTGEKIYHLPSCKSYAKTVISPDHGERYFCTEAEAVAAGWRKAQNCA